MPLPKIIASDPPPAPVKIIGNTGWDAEGYFKVLHAKNKLCRHLNFSFGSCSGLQGFYDALAQAGSSPNFIAVDDSSEGYTALHNSPFVRTVKTIFFTMRHKAGNMNARNYAMALMREIFRQFMSALIREKVKLEENNISIDPRIQFNEIESYFFTGAACAYFQIAVDIPQDLRFNPSEWTDDE